MNGQEPNNQGNNNLGYSAPNTLGNAPGQPGPIPTTIPPMPNPETPVGVSETPMESLNQNVAPQPTATNVSAMNTANLNNAGVVNANAGELPSGDVEPLNNDNSNASPLGMDPVNVNGFAEPNKVENIGTMPPPVEPKKKPMNKTLFVVLIIVLIAAVAFGVYTLLNRTNNKNKAGITITAKNNLSINLGDEVQVTPSYYADIVGTDVNNCKVDTSKIDASTPGSYEFTVECGSQATATGTISVVGTLEIKPIVALKPAYHTLGDTNPMNVTDFVESCQIDGQECASVTFADESVLNNYLATAGGPYDIEIVIQDAKGTSKTVVAPLYVTSVNVLMSLTCKTNTAESVEGYNATKNIADVLPIGSTDGPNYLDAGRRVYTYTFTDQSEYEAVVLDHEFQLTFDGITGLATYDDATMTFSISTNLDMNDLNTEAGGAFNTSYSVIRPYYQSKGYTCE